MLPSSPTRKWRPRRMVLLERKILKRPQLKRTVLDRVYHDGHLIDARTKELTSKICTEHLSERGNSCQSECLARAFSCWNLRAIMFSARASVKAARFNFNKLIIWQTWRHIRPTETDSQAAAGWVLSCVGSRVPLKAPTKTCGGERVSYLGLLMTNRCQLYCCRIYQNWCTRFV